MFFNSTKLNYLESILNSLNYSYTYDDNQQFVDIHLYNFPTIVLNNTKKELQCDDKTLELIKLDFFDYMYAIQKFKKVDMCSKTTSILWKHLILDTKNYMEFCSCFVGFYVHFDPYVESIKPSKSYSSEVKDLYIKSIKENYDYINYRQNTLSNYRNDNDTNNSLIDAYVLYSILETPKSSYKEDSSYKDNSNYSYKSNYNDDEKTSSKNYCDRDNDTGGGYCGGGVDCGGGGGGD